MFGGGATYEDMLSAGGSSGSAAHDQFASKMYGSSLSKSTGLPTTGGDVGSGLGGGAGGGVSSAFTKHTYDGSKSMGVSATGGYNYANQGYMGAYMGVSVVLLEVITMGCLATWGQVSLPYTLEMVVYCNIDVPKLC